MHRQEINWINRAFQALVAVGLVIHLFWPPILLPSIEPLIKSAELDFVRSYHLSSGVAFWKLIEDLMVILGAWIALIFWVSLGVALMRFVPVARGLLVLICVIGLLNFGLAIYQNGNVRDIYLLAEDASPVYSLSIDSIILLLAFLSPVSYSFSTYRAVRAQNCYRGGFPLFRSENSIAVYLLVATLVVLIGHRLFVEYWN